MKSPKKIYNDYIILKNTKNENKIYIKYTDEKLTTENMLETHDLVRYYNCMNKILSIYQSVLYQFIRANFQFIQRKSIYDSPNRSVFKKFLEIYSQLNLSDDNIEQLPVTKNDFIKIFGEKKESHKEDYATFYFNLYNEIKKINTNNNVLSINESIKEINDGVIKYSLQKNYGDRISYFFTPKDDDLFLMFGSWVISVHAVALSVLFSPGAAAVAAGSGSYTYVLTGTVGAAAGSLIKNTSFLAFRVYNIVLRERTNYLINESKFKTNIGKLNSSFNSLNEMKELISNINNINMKIGKFNFYFSNSFHYYCKLKEMSDKYSDTLFQNYFLNSNEYEKVKNKIKYTYTKSLSYFRLKKSLQCSLKIQIESMKELNLKSIYLLRNNSTIIDFINDNSNELENIISKVSRKLFKNEKLNAPMEKAFKEYLKHSLLTENSIIKLEKKKLFENEILNIEKEKSKTFRHEAELTLDYLRIMPFAINQSSNAFTNISNGNSGKILDPGLWYIASVSEAIMFITGSIDSLKNFEKTYGVFKKISAAYNIANFTSSSFMIMSNSWLHLFNNSVLSNMYSNPFSSILALAEFQMLKAVKKNYLGIWEDIYKEYNEHKEACLKRGNMYPSYDYFVKTRRILPMEAIHKLSDIFKDKFCYVSGLLAEINHDTREIVKSLEMERNPTHSCWPFQNNKDQKYEIFLAYGKILLKNLAISKEIRILEHYIKVIHDFDLEIDRALQTNFLLLKVDDISAFGITSFASNPLVNNSVLTE